LNNQKQELPVLAMFVNGAELNEQSLKRTLQGCFLPNFNSFPPGQMNRNLVGSIYGRSSIKIAHFAPIRLQTWPPQAILISDWLISKKICPSATAFPNELKFGRKHPWKVLYQDCSFRNACGGHIC
jgi:hypothetical protein